MQAIQPTPAPVRPRVACPDDAGVLPLDEMIASFAAEHRSGAVEIVGRPGAGKTTALAHLSAVLPPEADVLLIDDADVGRVAVAASSRVVVYTTTHRRHAKIARASFDLAPWSDDDLIEYLLAEHPRQCRHVMSHVLRDSDRRLMQGIPQLWRMVLDRMAGDESLARQRSRKDAPNPLRNTYQAGDGWLMFSMDNTDEHWARLAGTLGDLGEDARFASPEQRETNNEAVIAAIDAALAKRTVDEWMSDWEPLGLPIRPIANLQDLADDPQAWENDYFVDAYCEEVQRDVKVRGLPIGLTKTPGSVRTLGPELGQHTEEILTETLGYTWDQVVELKEQGAIL